jgi:hypothetical protein
LRGALVLGELNVVAALSGQHCRRMEVMFGRYMPLRHRMAREMQRPVQDQRSHRRERQARGDPLKQTVVVAGHLIAVPA